METKKRSIIKSIAWRFFSTINGFLVTWIITHEIGASATIAVIANVTGFILYYFHERAWNKIKWGMSHD